MNTTAALPRPRPFLPSDIVREPPGRALTRATFAIARNVADGVQRGAPETAEMLWPSDRVAHAVTRAATNPAQTTVSGFAGILSPTITGDFLASLVGESAGAKLINAAIRVSLDGVGAVLIPHRSANLPASNVAFVAEGGPFPIRQDTLATTMLGPARKLLCGFVATRELLSAPGAEDALGQLLRESTIISLDGALFSAVAADSTRPAGLLNGVAPLTATTGGGEAALRGDIGLIGGAVAAATGSANLAFITSPASAIKLATYPTVVGAQVQVWPSIAVAAGTIICVAVDAFVSAFSAAPSISASRDAVVHMEDAVPLQIATGAQGSGVLATPTRSLFQTDSIAIRCMLSAAWTLRSTAAVSWLSGATW